MRRSTSTAAGLDDVLMMVRNGRSYFYHQDALGSVRALTRSTEVVERYDYGDFGAPSFFDGAGSPIAGSRIGNPLLFTGHRYDEATGLSYCRARYLDHRAGRFLTRDPIGVWGDANNLGSAFTYVGNNPHTLVDPSGRFGDEVWWLVIAATAGFIYAEAAFGEGHFDRDMREDASDYHQIGPGNPNPDDGRGDPPGDIDMLKSLAKQKGGPLERRTVFERTPLGRYLTQHQQGIGPFHNPADAGFEAEDGGIGSGSGFSPNSGSIPELLDQLASRMQGSLDLGSMLIMPDGTWMPRPEKQGKKDGEGSKKDRPQGYFDEDMPGPPELVNPPPVPQRVP
ncbi:MAG: RHS repeat-associated core domain-containing protein [Planctomycetota bacterium]